MPKYSHVPVIYKPEQIDNPTDRDGYAMQILSISNIES